MFQGPINYKDQPAPGVQVDDSIFGIVMTGVETESWALGEVKKLIQLSDAEDLGIDASYDSNNGLLNYTHIKEFFRLNPTGTLWAILTATGQTGSELMDVAGSALKTLLDYEIESGGETAKPGIKVVGVVGNRSQTGSVWKAVVNAGGADYVVGDVISGTNGGGTGFAAKVTAVDAGAVTEVEIINRGSSYESVPTTFSTDSEEGAGATLTCTFYTPAWSSGWNSTLDEEVAKAQETVDYYFGQAVYVDTIFIEGQIQSGATLSSLTDLRTYSAPNVAVVAAQDPYIVSLSTAYGGYADIGSALGMQGIRDVSENLGSVDVVTKPAALRGNVSYPLTSVAQNRWLGAHLSNAVDVSSLTLATQNTLGTLGIIFVGKYEGFAGKYFSGDPTCKSATDAFSNIRANRVWNKAARIVRQTLLPKMRSKVLKDADGNIRTGTILHWEELVNSNLKTLMIDTEQVSNARYKLNQATTLNEDEQTVITGRLQVVKVDSADVIENYISFTPTISE